MIQVNMLSGVSLTFSAGEQLVFTGRKTIWSELLYKENFPLDGQTSRAKLSSRPVNLPGACLLMKPLCTATEICYIGGRTALKLLVWHANREEGVNTCTGQTTIKIYHHCHHVLFPTGEIRPCVLAHQASRFLAHLPASSQLLNPNFPLSLSTVHLQVSLGLPLQSLRSEVQVTFGATIK